MTSTDAAHPQGPSGDPAELDAYYASLGDIGAAPLWKSLGDLVPVEPRTPDVPFVWRYADVRPALMRAGELVSAEEAERRVLMLLNPTPSVAERGGTTSTLYAGIQLVLPGEVARAHHHVASAFRLVIESAEGAFTAVDGERAMMSPGDMVLTPNWRWHDHGNDSEEPVIWLDGLDIPVVNFFNANFFELYPDVQQKITKPDNFSTNLYIHGRLNPLWEPRSEKHSPVINYPWRETERALRAAIDAGAESPVDGVIFEYTNPFTGGSVMPTLSCFVQALRPGQHTQARRRTPSAVYHVLRGSGTTIIDGREFHWEQKDTFCVPSWAAHEHINGSASDEAVLFSFTNQAIYESLDFYREEVIERQE
jgi:gentisate 1,2-dioxygenase